MGSRGLSSKGNSSKTPKKWELSSKNAKDYGIMLKKRNTNKVNNEFKKQAYANLDNSLGTINQMGELLGLKPGDLPKVLLNYGAYSTSAYGDTNMFGKYMKDVVDSKSGEIIFTPQAVINLYIDGLKNSPDTAAHEMWHALEAKWIQDDFTGFDRSNAWIDNIFSKGICRNALVSMGKQTKFVPFSSIDSKLNNDVWKEQAQTIYRDDWEKNHPERTYASSEGRGKYAETITCTIQAALRYGEKNISPFGQAILKELRKEIKRRRGGKKK